MSTRTMRRLTTTFSLIMILSLVLMSTASAASTTKSLSTNFTLVNLGTSDATVNINYLKPDGTPWTGSGYTSLIVLKDGGQQIVRQYQDTLSSGQGSVVISSDQDLGSMVQIQNRSGVGAPTSGAYTGFKSGSNSALTPILAKKAFSSIGLSNTQIIMQNTGDSSTTVSVALYTRGATVSTPVYTKTGISIAPGASAIYDLADESDANLPANWWGSGVVTAAVNGEIAVVVNWFVGNDGLDSYEGVAPTAVTSKWFIPLVYIRLSNLFTSSIVVQNVSGVSIPSGDITLDCHRDPNQTTGTAELIFHNTTSFVDKDPYTFNTTNSTVFTEDKWQGGCTVTSASGKNLIVLVQHRYNDVSKPDQGAFIAIPGNTTDTTVYVPLVAKRLSNNFATTATIQNLDEVNSATVSLYYTPSGAADPTIIRTGLTILPGGSLVRNFRMPDTESPEMPNGWQGSLKVVSNRPVQALLANTSLTINGDQFMAYTGFTKP